MIEDYNPSVMTSEEIEEIRIKSYTKIMKSKGSDEII